MFREKLRAAAPKSEILNLDPFVDRLRWIKSAEEIKVMRETTRLSSLAILESMKSAKPGMYEHEIEAIADYIFKRHNAQGIGYYALVATGTNAFWPHYHAAQSRLEDGDMVLMDYAPDVSYYTTDVTRMFPANGTFSPRQREIRHLPEAVSGADVIDSTWARGGVARERPHQDDADHGDVYLYRPKDQGSGDAVCGGVRQPGRSFGHWLGMEAHDVAGANFDGVYLPGMMLTIEPALTIPDERIYIRLEDAILITANGFENSPARCRWKSPRLKRS